MHETDIKGFEEQREKLIKESNTEKDLEGSEYEIRVINENYGAAITILVYPEIILRQVYEYVAEDIGLDPTHKYVTYLNDLNEDTRDGYLTMREFGIKKGDYLRISPDCRGTA